MIRHINIYIRGKVQKVGFRFYTMQAAYKYSVAGFAKNQMDGSVYIEAEGNDKALEDFLSWCRNGPPGSVISEVITEESDPKQYHEFEIR